MSKAKVMCRTEDGIALVTLSNLPMNPLSKPIIDGLKETMYKVEEDDSVRCVIITGDGEKSFVAGADIKEFPDWTPEMAEELTAKGQRLMTYIENFPCPVIAAVNGFALGGGCELALACDFRIASENARFGLPETSLGIIPGYGGTQRLCRTIGIGQAKQMVYTAKHMKAQQALELGLVNEVMPQEQLLARCREIAAAISANGPIAVRAAKKAMNMERNHAMEQGLRVELMAAREVFASEDHLEGINAFIEKRTASFRNK